MTDYVLKISSYRGISPGAKHWRGRVQGEYPESCHGGMITRNGEKRCDEGHLIPRRAEWPVEAVWTEARYERLAARHFDGDGPEQFLSYGNVIATATERFRGEHPHQWWEAEITPGQPGDRLFLGHVPMQDEDIDVDDRDLDGQPPYGTMLAEIPVPRELSAAERGLLRHHLQVLSERSKMARNALGQPGLSATTVSWREQWETLITDLRRITGEMCSSTVAAEEGLTEPSEAALQAAATEPADDKPAGGLRAPEAV